MLFFYYICLTATTTTPFSTYTHTLALNATLPIAESGKEPRRRQHRICQPAGGVSHRWQSEPRPVGVSPGKAMPSGARQPRSAGRSEEHTSELKSLMRNAYAVLGLKKKTKSNR